MHLARLTQGLHTDIQGLRDQSIRLAFLALNEGQSPSKPINRVFIPTPHLGSQTPANLMETIILYHAHPNYAAR